MTTPCPNPWGSDNTPKAFSSLSGALASFIPPPTRTQVPRMSGVPSGSRLIAAALCDTFWTAGCVFGAPARRLATLRREQAASATAAHP